MRKEIVTYHEQMTYEGNQLTSVRDQASHYVYAGATDFDGIPGQEYPLTYNDAGSLTSDAGRRIAWIDYDLNNNPVRIQFTNGNVTKYVYSATGEKLRVTYQTAVPNISVPIGSTRELAFYEVQYTDSTDYLLGGRLTLKNGRIDKYQFEEGYCRAGRYSDTDDTFIFYYYDRDHLGNIRQVLKAKTGSVVQSMNYYPFGAQFCDGSTDSNVQSHRYNGKEFDKMHGLNTYDYGARQYNPVTAHWDRVDPLCEEYYSMSPYNYCGNNPIRFIDVDGRKIVDPNGKIVGITWDSNNSLIFTNNATPSIIRVANAMNLTETGRSQLQNLIRSDITVTINLSDITVGNGQSYTYGETIQGNNNRKKNYGTYYKNGRFGITEAHIKIYLGSLEESIASGSGFKLEGLTMEQAIGAVAGHESVHATNKDEIHKDKYSETIKGLVRKEKEDLPNKIEQQIIKEYDDDKQ